MHRAPDTNDTRNKTNAVLVQMRCAWHCLSVNGPALTVSNCQLVQVVWSRQIRSDVSVLGVCSHCVAVHVVSAVQTRS